MLPYKAVFFRGQTLDQRTHAEFAAQFGPLHDYPSATSDSNIVPIHQISARGARSFARGEQPDFIKDGDTPIRAGAWSPHGARCRAR